MRHTVVAMPKYDQPLERALKAIGGPKKMAAVIGITPSAVVQWERIPLSHLHRVSAATGIDPRELRPDFYEGEKE